MKKYTNEQLESKYHQFIAICNKYITGERLNRVLHMYSMEELGLNLMVSPASGNTYFHNAYEGGYMDHIFNVCKNSMRMKQVYQEAGADIDFTDEELIFAALHHDLGKLGRKGSIHYLPNDSEWHIKNRGEVYKKNDNNNYMSITDRTIFTLNHYGIQCSEKEYLGIKLTDGLYDESNTKYLKTYTPSEIYRTCMYDVLHHADMISTIVERQKHLKKK